MDSAEREEHYRSLERMYTSAPINAFYHPTLRVERGKTELPQEVRGDFFHAAQAVHGSVLFKLMDDAAYFAVSSLVSDVCVLTVTFNVHFSRPVAGGVLRAEGRVFHRSGRLFMAEAEVIDAQRKLVAKGSGSFMKSAVPLSECIGYS